MIISLPDVNIWIALAAEGHVHHGPAREWFAAQRDASVAFCRITQMGLLRLLTNSHVMGRAPRTIVQAWETFGQLRADRRLTFATEPDRLEFLWRQLMTLGWRWTEFLDGCVLGRFCRRKLVFFGHL